MIHNLLLLAAIFALLHAGNLTEVLSHLSKPLVVGTATLLGIQAADRGADIVLGQLVLPWTQDCSGVNTLVILWGVTLWMNRQRPFGAGLILRLLLCVPAALLANTFRILTLAAYRYAFYPAWESEELHYLIGFLWLIPFLLLFVGDLRRMSRGRWIEIVQLSLVLALLAPEIFAPGGSLMALATLVFLAHGGVADRAPRALVLGYGIWVAAGVLIAYANMESLWIPWLLLCPRLVYWPLLRSPSGLIILSGTVSILAMRPGWQIVVGLAIAYRLVLLIREHLARRTEAGDRTEYGAGHRAQPVAPRRMEVAALAVLGLLPFVLPALIGFEHAIERPPPGVMARQLTDNSYQVGLPGQPTDIRMYWYGAFGDGRHHSLPACMRFRGVTLEPQPGREEVLTGGGLWMRDFYIQGGELKSTYADYLLASSSPFAPPGVHVILDAPADSMSPEYFSQETERLARRLFAVYREDAAADPSPAPSASDRAGPD